MDPSTTASGARSTPATTSTILSRSEKWRRRFPRAVSTGLSILAAPAVARAHHGLDAIEGRIDLPELLAEAADVGVDDAIGHHAVVPPDDAEEALARED